MAVKKDTKKDTKKEAAAKAAALKAEQEAKAKAAAAAAADDSDSDDSSDDDSDDSDDSSSAASSSDSDSSSAASSDAGSDSDDSDDSDSDDSDDAAAAAAPTLGKRTASQAEPATPTAPKRSVTATKAVYVVPVGDDVDEPALRAFFAEHDVTAVEFRRCAVVTVENASSAAADALRDAAPFRSPRPAFGQDANGSTGFTPRTPRDAPSEEANTVFVGNAAFTVTEEDLRAHFGSCGNVDSVRIVTDRETGRPRGFCYVQFDSAEAARTAAEQLNGSDLSGRELRVEVVDSNRSSAGRGFGGDRGRGRGFGDRGRGRGFGDRGRGGRGFGGDRGRGFGAPRGFGSSGSEFRGSKMTFD